MHITQTSKFDAGEFLDSNEVVREYLQAAFETGDMAFCLNAINTVARARGMSKIANEAGVTRDTLYKALSDQGDPKFSTLSNVLKSLGLRISVEPIDA